MKLIHLIQVRSATHRTAATAGAVRAGHPAGVAVCGRRRSRANITMPGPPFPPSQARLAHLRPLTGLVSLGVSCSRNSKLRRRGGLTSAPTSVGRLSGAGIVCSPSARWWPAVRRRATGTATATGHRPGSPARHRHTGSSPASPEDRRNPDLTARPPPGSGGFLSRWL